jgi:hypothetical protein
VALGAMTCTFEPDPIACPELVGLIGSMYLKPGTASDYRFQFVKTGAQPASSVAA